MSHEICFYMRRNAYKIYKNDKAEMLHEAYLIYIVHVYCAVVH